MTRTASRLAGLLAPLALVLLAACELPPPGAPQAPQRVTATLLTAGTGVTHNGRPAVSGEAFRSGDRVQTGFRGSALIRFSDRTTVQVIEAPDPVSLSWGGDTVTIRMDDGVIEFVEGAVISAAEMIGRLASVFNDSHFVTEEKRTRFFRHDLFTGRAEMIRPQPGLPIAPGQYALVTPDGQVEIGQTSPRRRQELRQRFGRWDFARADFGMPNLLERSYADARQALDARGLRLGSVSGPQTGDTYVVAQNPRAGARVRPESRVDLVLERPQQAIRVRVPEVRKMELDQAIRSIQRAGLESGRIEGPRSRDSVVVRQDPRAGARVAEGTRVDLVLEAQQQVVRVPVPDLRKMELGQAIRSIRRAGLEPGRIEGSRGGDATVVVGQSPRPGTRVERGSRVDLQTQMTIQ